MPGFLALIIHCVHANRTRANHPLINTCEERKEKHLFWLLDSLALTTISSDDAEVTPLCFRDTLQAFSSQLSAWSPGWKME